jgi:hypothetical protein
LQAEYVFLLAVLHVWHTLLQVCQIQAQHALQLDAVHVKLQGVLAKKDATIAALRAELDATMMQLQHVGDALLDG